MHPSLTSLEVQFSLFLAFFGPGKYVEKINFAGSWLKPFPKPSFTHRTSQGPRKHPGRNRHGHGGHGGKLIIACSLQGWLGVLQIPICISLDTLWKYINLYLHMSVYASASILSSRLATCDCMKFALAKVLSTFFARVSKLWKHHWSIQKKGRISERDHLHASN